MTHATDDRAIMRMVLGSIDAFVFVTMAFVVEWVLLLFVSVETATWSASQVSPGRVASMLIDWNARYFVSFGMLVALAHGLLALAYGFVWGWRERLGIAGEVARIALAVSMTVFYLPILIADRAFEVPVAGWPTCRSLVDYTLSVIAAFDPDIMADIATIDRLFWWFGVALACAFAAYPLTLVIRRAPRKLHRVF